MRKRVLRASVGLAMSAAMLSAAMPISAPVANAADTVKIMPLGDSITFGMADDGGYRKYLDMFMKQKGYDNIDLEAAAARGIPVKNVAGYSTDSVVQETFMHILSLAGNAPYFDASVKSGEYSRGPIFTDVSRPFFELTGKTMGIIGLGTIGTKVAKVAEAFGMNVIYYSTSGTSHNRDYPSVPLDELMWSSDVISVHAPYNSRTAGLVGAKEFALMKPTAFIVNMGRGGIIDEAALAQAVDEGRIGGAALDVYVREPLPADSPLLHTRHPERLRFTPHTAWASVEARKRLVSAIAANIRDTFVA